MADRFRDSYRIPSARLQSWDYGWNAAYFVTICTAHRERYFGEVVAGFDNDQPAVQLSEIGEIAQRCWQEIPNHFPFVLLDEYVVMPNHVHGIIIVNKPEGSRRDAQFGRLSNLGVSNVSPIPNNPLSVADNSIAGILNKMSNSDIARKDVDASKLVPETPRLGVSTRNVSVDNGTGNSHSAGGKNDKWESGTLGVIINQYKRACTINARKIHADFAWQTRFHDHIIRNEESFQHIRSYIAGNPASWEVDTLYG